MEGSYELTPEYQDAIDHQRRFSWVFLIWLLFGAVVLYMTGIFARTEAIIRTWYLILAGSLLIWSSPSTCATSRISSYIGSFRLDDPGVDGHIVWHRNTIYMRSASQLFLLAAFTFILSVLSENWIILGGAIGLAATATDTGHPPRIRVRRTRAPTVLSEFDQNLPRVSGTIAAYSGTRSGARDDHREAFAPAIGKAAHYARLLVSKNSGSMVNGSCALRQTWLIINAWKVSRTSMIAAQAERSSAAFPS